MSFKFIASQLQIHPSLLACNMGTFSLVSQHEGFPGSSAGKESTCNTGNPGLIPGAGRSPGEGLGYPLQYSWTSLVAQTVKKLPSTREIWVRSLGWDDPLEEGMATHSSILAWKIPRDRGAWWATVHGVTESWTRLSDSAQHRGLDANLYQ